MLIKQLTQRFKQLVLLEKTAEPGEVILKQRRVFTLPGRAGVVFGLMLILLFLTSTNYNLNLGFGMTYLLAGLAVVNTLFTFRNLAYLRLNTGQGEAVFLGEVAEFPIRIQNTQNLARYAIHIGFLQSSAIEQIIDLPPNQIINLKLRTIATQRGYLTCPRIRLQTWFPLGLLRAWSTWLPDAKIIVYPTPEETPPPLPSSNEGQSETSQNSGNEDFSGVRSYQLGDPLKHLSWKHIARVDLDMGGKLVSKQFAGANGGKVILDFAATASLLNLEQRLSRLSAWVLAAERAQMQYGLRLGGLEIEENQGESHRNACLTALALFGLDEQHV
ncbi:DUF58 domain-containing protein [Undibacterium fentianense]|uniref:DUF58 domain-containing protein n=1 Tax=Undibacterium fentianense TaxID=2828728 RepID=A0A941E1F7_9BURK|nr:DUF58 domain-containing protein [Undibacterium fentianense]MBR7799211.1 DUF58 domain-containing protein [Undibacterium fentianense]